MTCSTIQHSLRKPTRALQCSRARPSQHQWNGKIPYVVYKGSELRCNAHVGEESSSAVEDRGMQRQALVTVDEVRSKLASRGMTLKISTLGPFYRLTCRDAQTDRILAVTNGWVDSIFKYMHCEALQIFTRGMRGQEGQRIRGGALGLGLLLGTATFAYALERGCSRAEILAINDDEHQHRRLVKYYTFFGFVKVKEVGDGGLEDVLEQLVWGGVGTRMDADVITMLKKWTSAIRREATS